MSDDETPDALSQIRPIFIGAPWAQKFGGFGSELSLGEWVSQINYLAEIQGLSGQQKLQFVLVSLKGEAKREIQAAPVLHKVFFIF